MRLLVSVRSSAEAAAARDGGADVIDAKEPTRGALGPVDAGVLHGIVRAATAAPVSAALGEQPTAEAAESLAAAFAAAGVRFVKVGLAAARTPAEAQAILEAATRGAAAGAAEAGLPPANCTVVAVHFADATAAATLSAAAIAVAARAGASGMLIDTIDKHGPGLRDLVTPVRLTAWVREVHAAGMLAAVAGRIAAENLDFVRASGADLVGVRGAACDGGRTGLVAPGRVRALRDLLDRLDRAATVPRRRRDLRRTPASHPRS